MMHPHLNLCINNIELIASLSFTHVKMSFLCNRYGGFSLGARSSQYLSNKDDIDDAIAQLRRRFHLERVRDVITLFVTPS